MARKRMGFLRKLRPLAVQVATRHHVLVTGSGCLLHGRGQRKNRLSVDVKSVGTVSREGGTWSAMASGRGK